MKTLTALLFSASIFAQTVTPPPGAGGGGTVTSVSGTANQVCVATGTTTPVLSICTALDLSGLTSTKPIKSGTSLPATCGVGEFYDKTDATAGSNLYSCTATNTWTVVGGGASPAGSAGCVQLYGTSTTFVCDPLLVEVIVPTAVGMTGLQVGLPEPDAPSLNEGAGNSISISKNDYTIFNYVNAGQNRYADINYYKSAGTLASPDNITGNTILGIENWIAYKGGAWGYAATFSVNYRPAGAGFIEGTEMFWTVDPIPFVMGEGGAMKLKGEAEWVLAADGGIEAGLHIVSAGVMELNDNTPVSSGGNYAQLNLSQIQIKGLTTGAATGKHVACIDPTTKQVYESSTGTDCSN